MRSLIAALERRWYSTSPVIWLVPLAALHRLAVGLRRMAYARGWLAQKTLPVPVLVIGNVTAGGSGKTPLTLAVVERLQARGRSVAVVSRGYGGHAETYPLSVTSTSSPEQSGDEPLLIARRTGVPVIVDPDRPRAAQYALDQFGADFIVADDGLQHYALARDAEIAVRDGSRGYGNGWLLPAGPLREPLSRLNDVDMECVHAPEADFWLAPGDAQQLDGQAACPLSSFAGQRVHGVAGIGYPDRFFAMLRGLGIRVIEHAMPDHHRYQHADVCFDDGLAVLMTEKDAVKCRAFAAPQLWFVPVETHLSSTAEARIDALLERLCAQHTGRSPVSSKEPA